jgi:hypothetical protein
MMSEAWSNYHKATFNVLMIYEEFKKTPNKQSIKLAYQGALINLESAKCGIHEGRDIAYQTKLSEWLP